MDRRESRPRSLWCPGVAPNMTTCTPAVEGQKKLRISINWQPSRVRTTADPQIIDLVDVR
jgi:hypothetical protein